MNSYERYMGMVKGERVDFVPRVPILMHFAAKHINATYADFARDHRVFTEAKQRLVEDFGMEQLDLLSDPWREMADYGGEIEYLESTCPSCVRHPLQDSRDIDALPRLDPKTSGRCANAIRAVRAFKDYGWQKYSITGWVEGPAAEASDVRGVSNYLTELLTDEVFSCELMDFCVDNAIVFAKAQLEAGCDTIGMGDAIASQISPDMYERLVLPREKRLIEAIQAAGGLVRLHICGDINHLLPMIATLGVDILDCDWMVDMEKARSVCDPKTVLAGNLDPVSAVMESTPEAIHQAFKELYEKVGNPYFVNAGCEIPLETPPENLRAVCEPIPAK